MEALHPPAREFDHQNGHGLEKSSDFDAILEENKQLRELVIQLSKLVIKNAVEK